MASLLLPTLIFVAPRATEQPSGASRNATFEGCTPPTNPSAKIDAFTHSRVAYVWDGVGSQRTFWSTSRTFAESYAGPDGVILETDARLRRTEPGDPELFPSDMEVQVIGEVTDALVTKP